MNKQTEPRKLDGRTIERIWMILYGEPGIGKTRLCATAPDCLFLDFDMEGTLSIADSGHLFWEVTNAEEWETAWKWVVRNGDQFSTLVFDSLTMLQVILHDKAVPAEKIDVDQRRLGGKSFRQLRNIYLETNRTFPAHDVIWVCDRKERTIDDKEFVVPALSPAPLKLLNRMCRLVGHLYQHTSKRREGGETVTTIETRLQVWNDGKAWGKDSSGVLPRVIRDPDLAAIFKAIKESGTTTDE